MSKNQNYFIWDFLRHLEATMFQRLLNKNIFIVFMNGKNSLRSYATLRNSSIKMKIMEAPAITPKTYQHKNLELGRALSPHLTIYKPQLTSMMSITLRMTGFALGVATWAIGLTSLWGSHKMEDYVEKLKTLPMNDYGWMAVKTVLGFPFSFHLVAGARHLLFDTARLMEIKQFYATGYAALVLSAIMAIAIGMVVPLKGEERQ
uniref:Uncharacterized protein n=1 Tax=Stomoxys calcitrans TaxID=35570 RepID=A0A1I8PIX8_STOCA